MKSILAALGAMALCAAVPTAKIDADMNAAVARHQTAGMTIAIVQDGSVVYEHAYGLRNVEANEPATVATDYEIGSITKQFTAAAVLQLVDAGKISLDAPVATYLPSVPHPKEVTIRELLTHTSGLANYTDGADAVPASAHLATFDELIARIAGKPLLFTPGTQWSYSNTNYLILGRVIEIASGQQYESYLFQHVLALVPGQRFATMADEGKVPQMARGYAGTQIAPPLDNSWAGPAGNLVGTVSDLIAWDRALESGAVVPPADYRQMTTSQTPPNAAEPYGYGFIVDRFDAQPRVWHNGGTFGFNASNQYFPDQHTRIIVLANDSAAQADGLAEQIYEDLYPDIAAAYAKPAPGEDPTITAHAKAAFLGFASGHVDRALFDAQANAAFTDAVVSQASAQFTQLGAPQSYTFRGCRAYGAARVCKYSVAFTSARLVLTVGVDADGTFNTYLLGSR